MSTIDISTSSSSIELQENENIIDKSKATHTNSSDTDEKHSKNSSELEQSSELCTKTEIHQNEVNSSLNRPKLSINNSNDSCLLELKEIDPNISVENKSEKKHRKHKTDSKEDIFKRVTDEHCLLDTDLNEQSLYNCANLCIFPDLLKTETGSFNLSQSTLAFSKLSRYIIEQAYMDILIKFHIDKVKEIILSNLSDSISIKSYTIASSQIVNGKVKISTHNEWWTYFKSFYDFFEVLVLKLEEVSQNSETYSSLDQSNLGAAELINSQLPNKTSQDLLNVVIDTNIIKALVQKLCSDIEKERRIALIFIKFLYRKMPSIQTIILKQIEYILLKIIHEDPELNGTQEILKFMYKQISSSEYFKTFAYSVLLPLHKVQTVILFHKFLMKCCRKYQRIHNEFANSWVEAIVRYWPYGNSSKELLFLNELDEALKLGKEIISINIWELAIQKLSNEIPNIHKKVSSLAVSILSSDLLRSIVRRNSPLIVLKSIRKAENLKGSRIWDMPISFLRCKAVESFAQEYLKVYFKDIKSYVLVSSLARMHDVPSREKPEAIWDVLLNEAKKINPNFKNPKIPYQSKHVSGLANMNDAILSSGNLIPAIFLY